METVDTDVFWSRVVDAPDCFGELQATDAAWHERAVVVWRVVGETLVQREGNDMLVAAWENNLGLAAADGAEPGARKVALLNHMCSEGLPVPAGLLESVLTRMLGEGRARVKHSGDTLTVSVALDTTEEQIAEVQKMLDRVLPRNLVREIDPFPCDFEKVEYLESTGTQYLNTGYIANSETTTKIRWAFIEDLGNIGFIFCPDVGPPRYAMLRYADGRLRCDYGEAMNSGNKVLDIGRVYDLEKRGRFNYVDGELVVTNAETEPFEQTGAMFISTYKGMYRAVFRLYSFIMENNNKSLNLIPAIDNTGTPCMYDFVSKQPIYNSGTGDFLYPGKETQAATYSLRNRMYAQLTEHGVRRLYRVPAGYNGGKEEYAAEHGFKLLIETPQPEEGYWTPVWHDREDCIELEWVETEAPEEGLEP